MTNELTRCLLISLAVSSAVSASGDNWPNWRGPNGDGVSSDKNLPLNWSDKENVRWRVDLPGPGNSSPIVWGDRVFVSQYVEKDNRRTLMCLDRASGKVLWQSGINYANREPTQENNPYLWKLDRVKSGMGSGVIHGGDFYTISSDGIAVCLDLSTGKTVWEERLKGPGARGTSWSSMLLAGDKIYVPNQSGDSFVLRASPKFEVLATNSVGEPTNASLAASNDELFLRTDKALWCFANPK